MILRIDNITALVRRENLSAQQKWDALIEWNNLIKQVKIMDKELDILHELITELYNHDNLTEKIKATLDKIKAIK